MSTGSRAGSSGGAGPIRVAFVCVRNAGRSQMSAAFAEREVRRRSLGDAVEVRTGGTDPADAVHPVVVEAMREADLEVAGREPRAIGPGELEACDYVVTMGCSTLELGADLGAVDHREWALPDPGGQDLAAVRAIREEVAGLVGDLFDEIELERRTRVER